MKIKPGFIFAIFVSLTVLYWQIGLPVSPNAQAATFVQVSGNHGGDTALSAAISPSAAGNLIVVCVSVGNHSVTSVTDNQFNTYNLANRIVYGGGEMDMYYAYGTTGGVTTVTAHPAAWDGSINMAVAEYAGAGLVNPLDQTSVHDNGYNGGASWTSGTTPVTGQADELLVGCARDRYVATTFTAGTGYVARHTENSILFLEDQNVSAIGSYAATGTRSGASGYNIDAVIGTFRSVSSVPVAPAISSFSASPSSITSGQTSVLSWSVSGSPAPTLSISGVGTVTGSSVSVSPTQTTTYTLSATNSQGTVTSQATVTVVPQSTAPPTVSSFIASPSSITSGQSSTLSWSVSSGATVSIDNGVGNVSGSSVMVTPSQTTTYTLTAANAGGSITAQTTVTVSASPPPSSSGGPVLMFSDLAWGPKTGWEGSAAKGAAVTVWGKNFGSTRGSSYVTVNGAQVNSTDYAEWDAAGPARGLERIVFWLNSSMADGAGQITVTVGGQTSNPLPFTVAAGTIYFISPSGSNSNNGFYATSQGGSNGPFRDPYMFSPAHNPSGDGQYIAYIRGGTYSTLDSRDYTYISLLDNWGGATRQKALVGYPGEIPIFDGALGSLMYTPDYLSGGSSCCGPDYLTFAKLTIRPVTACVNNAHSCAGALDLVASDNSRLVANTIENMRPLQPFWAGYIFVGSSKHDRVLGNYLHNNGFDSYSHDIYIKTQTVYSGQPLDLTTDDTEVGWNEFDSPYSSQSHGAALFVSHGASPDPAIYPTSNTRIHDNYFHGGNESFFYVGDNTPIGGDVWFWNNLLVGGGGNDAGVSIYCGAQNVYNWNNTFYQSGAANAMVWVQSYPVCPYVPHAWFANNIWYGRSGQTFLNMSSWGSPLTTIDHDLFYDPNGTTAVPASSGGLTVSGSFSGNPQFVNAASIDFHLQSFSPAINAGVTLTSVASDYDANPRPQGAAYDIGALEYASGYTPPASDTTAPSVPANLAAIAVSSSAVNLSWTASTDNVGVTGYRVYRNGIQIGTTANTSYNDTGLTASTQYSYTVSAYDAAGNASAQSAIVTVTTRAVLPVISNLIGSNTTATTTQISWNTNVPTNGQVFYGLTSVYGSQSALIDDITKTTSHSLILTSLTPATAYHFKVTSIDALSNSTSSPDFTFTTLTLSAASSTVPTTTPAAPSSPVTPPSGGGSSGGGGGGGGGVSPVVVYIPPAATATANSEVNPGVLRLVNHNGTFYLIENGKREGITNPGMLYTYGFTFGMAKTAADQDMLLPEGSLLTPENGSLVKSSVDKTVYLISGQQRYAFTSAQVFLGLGFKFSSVLIVTDPELQALPKAANLSDSLAAHMPGLDINRNGTIYWIGADNQLHGYPDLTTFNSWHLPNDFTRVVPANQADLALPVGKLVGKRVVN
ncbi:MAG: hypothetical protein KGJ93_03350 [Patescibacteria group bacterium]|nr:hypothetical protein [Patescibacteria group bacterium]